MPTLEVLTWLCVALTVTMAALYFRTRRRARPPTFHGAASDSPMMQYVLSRCRIMSEPFRATFWASNAHVQTILASFLPAADIKFERKYVGLQDGGQLALDWAIPPNGCEKHSKTILVVLPGLTGDAVGMSHLCLMVVQRGFRAVVFNKRGHGGSRITTPKLQSFGDPVDLRQAIVHIQREFPDCVLTAIGHSAGSGILAAYLGEYGKSCIIQAAAGVSPGYDLKYLFTECIKQPYNTILMKSLKAILRQHAGILSTVVDVDRALAAKDLAEFEERLYFELYKNKRSSMEEHWDWNNPCRNVPNGAIPVLCISSLDDPVCRKDCIMYSLFENSQLFTLMTVDQGGHCGFLEGARLERWADKVTLDYITAVLEYFQKTKTNVAQ